MAESTLSLGYPDFMAEVGFFLGYGRSSAGWSAAQQAEIDALVQSGYRQFLNPEEEPGRPAYEWTFLRPVVSLVTVASTYSYQLPDDFGGLDGDFTFNSADKGYLTIRVVGEDVIRGYLQNPSIKGRPRYAAVQPIAGAGANGQRFNVLFWPIPDAVYTLSYRYRSNPGKLTAANPYPLGGMSHGETILESCLAVAEIREDDEMGIHNQQFKRRLSASILADRRGNTPEFFGYNGDQSDMQGNERFSRVTAVSFKGVTY